MKKSPVSKSALLEFMNDLSINGESGLEASTIEYILWTKNFDSVMTPGSNRRKRDLRDDIFGIEMVKASFVSGNPAAFS